MDGLKKAVVLILIIFTGDLFAKEQFTECFNCSISQRQAVAISEASPTIDSHPLQMVHVADIARANVSSFRVSDIDGLIHASQIDTPKDIKQSMSDYRTSRTQLAEQVNQTQIPESVLPSAWA